MDRDEMLKKLGCDYVLVNNVDLLEHMLLFNFPDHEDKEKIREVFAKWYKICEEKKQTKEEPIKFEAFKAARQMALRNNGYSKEFIEKFGLDEKK